MQLAELTGLLVGATLALGGWTLMATCRERDGRRLGITRALLPFVDVAVLGLAFASQATPALRALAAVGFAVAFLAVAIALTAARGEPAWWDSFESAFWRYLDETR